jgi:hypothetical protein
MSDAIEVYSDLEIILGQKLFEDRNAADGGDWDYVHPQGRPYWFDKARSILAVVFDYAEMIEAAEEIHK